MIKEINILIILITTYNKNHTEESAKSSSGFGILGDTEPELCRGQ
jgi:hypothetical protein